MKYLLRYPNGPLQRLTSAFAENSLRFNGYFSFRLAGRLYYGDRTGKIF